MLPRTVVDHIYKQLAAWARRLPFKAGFVIHKITYTEQTAEDRLSSQRQRMKDPPSGYLFVINFTEFLVRDNAQTCTCEATIKVHVNNIWMPPSVVWNYYVKLGYECISFQSE